VGPDEKGKVGHLMVAGTGMSRVINSRDLLICPSLHKLSATPQEIVATRWRRKGEFEDLATGLPFAGFLLAGAFLNYPWLFIPGVVAFLVGFTLQRIRFRRCRCEKCGSMLYRKPVAGPISFACAKCDIIWITRVHQDLQ
jgi:hypothetical protein